MHSLYVVILGHWPLTPILMYTIPIFLNLLIICTKSQQERKRGEKGKSNMDFHTQATQPILIPSLCDVLKLGTIQQGNTKSNKSASNSRESKMSRTTSSESSSSSNKKHHDTKSERHGSKKKKTRSETSLTKQPDEIKQLLKMHEKRMKMKKPVAKGKSKKRVKLKAKTKVMMQSQRSRDREIEKLLQTMTMKTIDLPSDLERKREGKGQDAEESDFGNTLEGVTSIRDEELEVEKTQDEPALLGVK
ncbi:unnamed protein product [Cylicocyclus nassatus]|uniref:Uncharacterized protein n=1 Tax=Cylicocyclus nassatus TaxID=53992 RepID=A0AA36DMP7_CYLNA|nr:unnamed protein product [Cylicocyclus nassatus]